jgi:plastocyanin
MGRRLMLVTIGLPILLAFPAGAAETRVIKMAGMQYEPASLTVAVGDTLRFVNDDNMDHEVFVPSVGFAVDLGVQKPGGESTYIPARSGRFEVECVLHDGMRLMVEVRP